MDLDAPPFDNQIEFLLQFFDDALADKAERSYIVGKDLQLDRHRTHRPSHVQRMTYIVPCLRLAGDRGGDPSSYSLFPRKQPLQDKPRRNQHDDQEDDFSDVQPGAGLFF